MSVALRYAETSAAVDQIARELWHTSHEDISHRKLAAFKTYLQTRAPNVPLASEMVLTRGQIGQAVENDMTVAAIRTTMVEAVDELGGFLAPETYHESVLARVAATAIVRPRATVLPAFGPAIRVPRATGGDARFPGLARVTWVSEQPAVTAAVSGATFGSIRAAVHTAMCVLPMSRNLFEDGGGLMMTHLEGLLGMSFAADEDTQSLVGTGAGTPSGLLPGGLNSHGLTEISSGSAAALTPGGLISLSFAPAPQYRRAGRAVWVMATSTLKDCCEMVDGAGRPLISFDATGDAVGRPMLRGYPVEEVSDGTLPSVAAGNFAVIFGDLSGVVLADRIGLSVQVADSAADAEQNKLTVFARRRVGGVVSQPERLAVQKIAA